MRAQEAAKQMRIAQWAAQVKECTESGQTVRQWCAEHGIVPKTYYCRRKRVREELLDAIEPKESQQLANITAGSGLAVETSRQGVPVFATLPAPKAKGAAVTVWIGNCAVDIQNDASTAVIEQTLKAVSRL